MTPEAIHTALIEELRRIAPESAPETLPAEAVLREEVDLDSMDFLNLVTALHQRLDIPIPERDYDKLDTLAHAESYLAGQVAARETGGSA